jgi:hypothetical protein
MASRMYWSRSDEPLPPQAPLVIGLIAVWGLALAAGKVTGLLVGKAVHRIFRGRA